MTAKTVAIGVALVLVGCTYEPGFIFGDRVSGNAETVTIKASYLDPGPKATEHCAKYDKSAVLENVTPMSGFSIYTFKCL